MINKEKLTQELEQLKAQKEQAIAQVNALIGAENLLIKLISECEDNEDTGNKPE